ncbi:MAG: tetratricopeptide repeat protein [Proteobacteria bacterium]|nr:tetratricopeptide repeat protein [Pseudomonadota bacterium]
MFADPNDRRNGYDRRSGLDRRREDRRNLDDRAFELQGKDVKKSPRTSSGKGEPAKKDLAQAWNNKGKDFVERREYEEAKKAFQKALEIKPRLAEAWYNLANVCGFQGEKEEAFLSLRKAIEIDPGYKNKAGLSDNFKRLKGNGDFKKLLK